MLWENSMERNLINLQNFYLQIITLINLQNFYLLSFLVYVKNSSLFTPVHKKVLIWELFTMFILNNFADILLKLQSDLQLY